MLLPPDHHYVRYCGPSQCQEGKVLSRAFRLRERDIGTGLSGDHFEHFGLPGDDGYRQILAALTGRGFHVKPDGCFAKLKCGAVTGAINHLSFDKPDSRSSHTYLKGLEKDDDLIPELLALLVCEAKPAGGV
ncbi:MAG: hypothetical protein LBP80_02940 [Treponema sp.]|jgi:hypothetical protein|nr:hypothetical protein [Treponema sp.]